MTAPPEIQIAVAVLALVGVLITGIVTINNANARNLLERELVNLRSKLESDGTAALQQVKNAHDLRLVALESDRQAVTQEAQVRQNINAENWRRVLGDVRDMKNVAKELIDAMHPLCVNGHEMDDVRVLDETLATMKMHRDFREKMKPLFGEIREVDYQRLEAFHRYQGELMLDIGRTKSDRIAKQGDMQAHADRLHQELRLLEGLVSAMLRPRFDH